MSRQHVRARARSIAQYGLINPPIVRRDNWEVVAGCDRIAACMLLGWERIECDVRDLTEPEARILARVDNIERRHDPDEQRRETEALEEAVKLKLTLDGLPAGARSMDAAARKIVSAETGIKEETLRKRAQRAQRKQQNSEPPPPRDLRLPARFEALGLQLTEEYCAQISTITNYLAEAQRMLGRCNGALTAMESAKLPLASLQSIRETLDLAANQLRAYAPAALCPYCRGEDGDCKGCGQLRWVSRGAMKLIPDAVWTQGTQEDPLGEL